jgi:molybdopterin/thiamine biosynthesis adenylyltransferase
MKLLVLGCGGIGSHFIEELCTAMKNDQIRPMPELTIADNDIVEMPQIMYQNFRTYECGGNKARMLAKRFSKEIYIKTIEKRIQKEVHLKGFDFIISCVDNEPTRELIIQYAFKKGIQFLDLRATGRHICAFPKLDKIEDNLKYVDIDDITCYSCQAPDARYSHKIDMGHKIIAMIGMQMFLNHLRGLNNKIINLTI